MLYDKWWKSPGDTCMRTEKGKESKANSLGVDNIGNPRKYIFNVSQFIFYITWIWFLFNTSNLFLLCFDRLSRPTSHESQSNLIDQREIQEKEVLLAIRANEFLHLPKVQFLLLHFRRSIRCTTVRTGVRRGDRNFRVLLQYQKAAAGTGKYFVEKPTSSVGKDLILNYW